MSTVYEFRPIFGAITTRLGTQTSKPVGQAVKPDTDETPYPVIYPWPDLRREGGLTDPNQITIARFQVTCVGGDMAEAQWMQHKTREALLDWVPQVAGVTATPIELDDGSGVLRDDDRPGDPVFYTTDRFRFWLTGLEEESSSS